MPRSRPVAWLIALLTAGCGSVPLPSWMPFEPPRSAVRPAAAGGVAAAPVVDAPLGMIFRHHVHWLRVPPVVVKGGRQVLLRGHVTVWGAVPAALGGDPSLVPVRVVLIDPRGPRRELPIVDPLLRWESGELRVLFKVEGAVSCDFLPDDPFTCDQFVADPDERTRWPIELTFARALGGPLTLAGEIEEADLGGSTAAEAYLATPTR